MMTFDICLSYAWERSQLLNIMEPTWPPSRTWPYKTTPKTNVKPIIFRIFFLFSPSFCYIFLNLFIYFEAIQKKVETIHAFKLGGAERGYTCCQRYHPLSRCQVTKRLGGFRIIIGAHVAPLSPPSARIARWVCIKKRWLKREIELRKKCGISDFLGIKVNLHRFRTRPSSIPLISLSFEKGLGHEAEIHGIL